MMMVVQFLCLKRNGINMFKVGDIVEAFGVKGKVIDIDEERLYGIEVEFQVQEETKTYGFIKGGLSESWHKEPSLKLISRPKKMEKIIITDNNAQICVRNQGYYQSIDIFYSQDLKGVPKDGYYKNVKVTLEFEVEEE